jgi:acyl-CoA synthetase (NDP forming)
MPVSNPVDLWPAIERNGPEVAWGRAFRAVCADPNVDAVFFHVFVGGFSGKTDISSLVEIARAADKPVFGWLLGKRTEARDFLIQANEMGVPVFREIQRAVECMAAVFKRSNYLQRRNNT